MLKFIDQINHSIQLKSYPKRIISLVPSQTELLYDLGLEKEVIGITKFCIYPDSWYNSKTRVGGTKTLKIDLIKELQPDLIIANKEENTKDQILLLQQLFPVWTSDIKTLEEAYEMICSVGELTNKCKESIKLKQQVQNNFNDLEKIKKSKKDILYLIWKEPYMTIGGNTFINEMLIKCGLNNITKNKKDYPEITEREQLILKPDYVFLSSEPYPFKEKHINTIKEIWSSSNIQLVDGEMFSWYGSRLKQSPAYFIDLIDKMT